ncbi:MAG: hypothetical protein B7733_08505 [Myxococcales bacterium FL481]|nr:MAG: hypothetical protein B7733_08505 [Myxococcales bacterium FL481]
MQTEHIYSAKIEYDEDISALTVRAYWELPQHGLVGIYNWALFSKEARSPKMQKLAGRLAAAVEAGAALHSPELKTRDDGTFFGHCQTRVHRTLNADLKRLGF